MIPIPWWAKIGIALAWKALASALRKAGVDQDVIDKIEEILRFIGVLGGTLHRERVHEVHMKCSGVACPPDLKV